MSLIDTCTNVYAGSPLVRALQTNTIAVHGATPRITAPVMKSCARSAGISGLKINARNSVASPNIRNGLIPQVLPVDMRMALGCFLTFMTDLKSTFIIIG